MAVHTAIVPLYPKLRLSARGLLNIASEAYLAVRGYVGSERATELEVDLSFQLCGDYVRELYESGLPEVSPLIEFVTTVPLSRYVGIVRFFLGSEALVDVVCDTTDIDRSRPKFSGVLAFLPLVPNCVEYFRGITERYLR